jgi:hypothetical protein
MNMSKMFWAPKLSSLHHTLATELDQKFWPPNSHSKSTTLGQEGLGFRVAKKSLSKPLLKIDKKVGFPNTHQNH